MTSILLALYLSAVPTVTVAGKVLTPDGSGVTAGTITCRLTTPGSALDGSTMQRVASEVTTTITAGTGAVSFSLVPNDAIIPTGSRYTCTYRTTIANGRQVQWAEQWQLTSTPNPLAIGNAQSPTWPLGSCQAAAQPIFTPAAGNYRTSETVTVTTTTPNSVIYYTTNGTTPTNASTVYTSPVTVTSGSSLRAITHGQGWGASAVTTGGYEFDALTYFPLDTPGCYSTATAMGSAGELVTVSRADSGTYLGTDGSIGTCTANQARVSYDSVTGQTGLLVEPASTNLVTYSEDLSNGAWTNVGTVNISTNQGTLPGRGAVMDLATSTANTAVKMQYVTTSNSAGPHYFCAWLASDTGTETGSIGIYTGPSNCSASTCFRSDGGACTPATALQSCSASASVGTTPVRLCVRGTSAAARTSFGVWVHDGVYNSTNGVGILYGGMQFEQATESAWPTSYIPSTGASTTPRAADVVSIPSTILASHAEWCSGVTMVPTLSRPWSGYASAALSTGSGSGASRASLLLTSSNIEATLIDGSSGSLVRSQSTSALAAGESHRLAMCQRSGGVLGLYLDGDLVGTTTGAGTGVIGTPPATFRIGADGGGTVFGSALLTDFRVGRGFFDFGLDTNLTVSCLGDSITHGNYLAGGSTTYPMALASLLGYTYTVANDGYGGNTTAQMLTRWTSTIRATDKGTVVILGGINDVMNDIAIETTKANLTKLYTQVVADGATLIPVTITPWKNYVSFTAPREAVRVALNVWIKGYCTAHGLTCVDADADFDDGTGALKAAYDWGDGLHPNVTGLARLATLVDAAMP